MQTGMKSVAMSELQVGDRVQTGMKSVVMSELKVGDRVQTGMKSVCKPAFRLTYCSKINQLTHLRRNDTQLPIPYVTAVIFIE